MQLKTGRAATAGMAGCQGGCPGLAGAAGMGGWFDTVMSQLNTAESILLPAVANRIQTQPGVLITNPGGQVISQQNSGYPVGAANVGASASGIGSGVMLLIGAAVLTVVLMKRR